MRPRRVVRFSRHARDEMEEANATEEDVRHALAHAARCDAQPKDTWLVHGVDRDGVELQVVVVFSDPGLFVITVF